MAKDCSLTKGLAAAQEERAAEKARESAFSISGIECGKGWAGLYGPLIDLCKFYGFEVLQVKEKFGRLTFYYGRNGWHLPPEEDPMKEIVAAAYVASGGTCEECGTSGTVWDPKESEKAGKMVWTPKVTLGRSATSGWIRALCTDCRRALDEKRMKEGLGMLDND